MRTGVTGPFRGAASLPSPGQRPLQHGATCGRIPGMVKVLTFIHRRSGMAVEAFQQYWRGRHPDVVTRLPGVRRYVQSHVLESVYARGEPVYDGIAEVWADDTDALRAMTRSPVHADLVADEARFIDRARMGFIVTEDHVVVDGPAAGVKAVEFLARRPDLTVE